jgi:hypothetical protein
MAFGYGSQRGAFCMSSGLRGVLDGEWTKVKALGLAVAIQLVLLPAVFATGMARSAELSLKPLAAAAGGVLFGASMRWAGGCAAGVWYKLGAGDIGSLLAVLGMALGASAADAGPLHAVRLSCWRQRSPPFRGVRRWPSRSAWACSCWPVSSGWPMDVRERGRGARPVCASASWP